MPPVTDDLPLGLTDEDLEERVDFSGAIYGSMLAAATIVGTTATASVDTKPGQLFVALVVTSLVFWLMHVYVRVIGVEMPRHVAVRAAIRKASLKELPILVAVFPPALVVAVAGLLDEPGDQVGSVALYVALAGQVFWTWIALRQAHARRGIAFLSLGVSLFLGLVLVGLKVALSH